MNNLSSNYRTVRQAGMGVGVSKWPMANIVAKLGQIGTVSGTMLDGTLVYELQMGDLDGNIRRALSHFPFPRIKELVLSKFYVEGGIDKNKIMKRVQKFSVNPPETLIATTICANFVYVWLANEGHDNPVSINYLDKVPMPHIYALTGAILAGVGEITIGAGIPINIPQLIDSICNWGIATYPIEVIGYNKKNWKYTMSLDLNEFLGPKPYELKRPGFIPIISSYSMANILVTKCPVGSIQGFAIEIVNEKGEPVAGGHNARPKRNGVYGEMDIIDFKKIAEFGIPFWLGGGVCSPEAYRKAIELGASGVQIGTAFALCDDSGMNKQSSADTRRLGFLGELVVKTDMIASPTGYPFKVAMLPGTLSDIEVYNQRTRICNIGGLIVPYEREDGEIRYRCSAEPDDDYELKGGDISKIAGVVCLCNCLAQNANVNPSKDEPIIVTLGDNVDFLKYLMADENSTYHAIDVIEYILAA